MADVTTMDPILWPLMHLGPETAERIANARCCVVCGRNHPLNRHHIVRRGAGELYEGGRKLPHPVAVLCGNGNNLYDADGTMLCHGKAHHMMLHFRNDRGRLELLELDEPTEYASALKMGGWEPLETEEGIWTC